MYVYVYGEYSSYIVPIVLILNSLMCNKDSNSGTSHALFPINRVGKWSLCKLSQSAFGYFVSVRVFRIFSIAQCGIYIELKFQILSSIESEFFIPNVMESRIGDSKKMDPIYVLDQF